MSKQFTEGLQLRHTHTNNYCKLLKILHLYQATMSSQAYNQQLNEALGFSHVSEMCTELNISSLDCQVKESVSNK